MIVVRFLGTTPLSSNVHSLLVSIIEQLKRVHKRSDPLPSNFEKLKGLFHRALTEWPTPENEDRPLTIILDALDQLHDSNAGRRLDWLPITNLPGSTKIVVSTLPDSTDFECLSMLQAKLGDRCASHTVHVKPLTDIKEQCKVLEHLLRLKKRTVTQEQMEHICSVIEQGKPHESTSTPLWLTLVTQAASRWKSYEGVAWAIKPEVRDLVVDLFERLATRHGKKFVRRHPF